MSEVLPVVAEPETTAEITNVSASEFENRRTRQLSERLAPNEEPENPEEVAEAEPEIETEPELAEEPIKEEVDTTDEVLSQIDLDNLTTEQAQKLSEVLKSRAAGRIGKLTGDKKALQEKIDGLEASLRSQNENPLEAQREIKDNPFNDLKDTQAIQAKSQEIHDAIEYLEDVLYDASDFAPDDIVTEAEGQQYTKSQIREQLKQARKSRDTFLPDQYRKMQKKEQAGQLRQQYGQKALQEFSWLKDKESEEAKQFVSIAADGRMQKIYEEYPELGAQLPYLLAHAVNSINSSKAPVAEKKKKIDGLFSQTPPKSPASAVGTSEKSAPKGAKVLSELSSRFKESGSKNDFIKMRTLQFAR
jgi:hypothetical protein